MGIMGFYCKLAEYAVADGRQGVLLHVGGGLVKGLSTCPYKNEPATKCYKKTSNRKVEKKC